MSDTAAEATTTRSDEAQPDPARSPRARVRATVRRWTRRDGHLWPLLVILAVTLVAWTPEVWRSPTTLRLANPGDSESFSWYLSWNVHALTNGVDPFRTANLYAPDGLDLGNAISVPAVSLLVSPVAAAFGGTAAYNVAFVLALVLAGACVYLLARELTGSVAGATGAGVLMVLSPYFAGHALGHLNLLWVFGLPLLTYLAVRHVRGTLRARWVVVWTALAVAVTIGASTELFVTQSFFAAVLLAIALLLLPALRAAVLRTAGWLAAGVVAGVLLGLPVIVAGLTSGIPDTVANPPSLYSSDLTNLVAPTSNVLVGDSFFAELRSHWVSNNAENTAYLPITLVLLVLASAVARRSRLQAVAGAFAAVALVLSFGPVLRIAGVETLPMPWAVTAHVPGLDHALPGRFSAFVWMALCVLVAEAWARRALPRWSVVTAFLLTVVLLWPNTSQLLFGRNLEPGEFATSGALDREIEPGENVLVLPAGQWGPGMVWMDEQDFAFTMPTGNGGGAALPPALQEPVGQALWVRDLDFDYDAYLEQFLEEYDVDSIVVDTRWPEWIDVVDDVLGPGAGRPVEGAVVCDLAD